MNIWYVYAFILCLCCPVCRQRPCDWLITRTRSRTVCEKWLRNCLRGQGPEWAGKAIAKKKATLRFLKSPAWKYNIPYAMLETDTRRGPLEKLIGFRAIFNIMQKEQLVTDLHNSGSIEDYFMVWWKKILRILCMISNAHYAPFPASDLPYPIYTPAMSRPIFDFETKTPSIYNQLTSSLWAIKTRVIRYLLSA
jgi:hypothetical protein